MTNEESYIETELRLQFNIPPTNKLGKFDIGWLKIFSRKGILQQIAADGYAIITSLEQKEFSGQLEPRLLNKHDFSSNQPYIFVKEKLGALPIERNRYLIGRFNLFHSFPDTESTPLKTIPFPANIESIDHTDLTSEAVALHAAKVSGIFHDFLEVCDLQQTVSGRMGTGSFEMDLNSIPGGYTAKVSGAQIEVDAGYETPESLALVEAKNKLSSDFNVRQVFYPYRVFSEKMRTKPVRNIYQVYSDGIFHLYEFLFENPRDLSTIRVLRSGKYAFSTESVTRKDVERIASNSQIIPHEKQGVPFPQADVFARVVNLCEQIHAEGAMSKEDIYLSQDFTPRQADYYLNAARYIGLLNYDNQSQLANLSCEGRQIMENDSPRQRRLGFASAISRREPFLLTLRDALQHGEIPSRERILENMDSVGLTGSTLHRRASTVEGWIRWILDFIVD